MKWSDKTLVEWDTLIHEKVMGVDPAISCDGAFVSNPHDGHETLYCSRCDAGIFFGDSKTHKQPLVPAYTTDMNAALQMLTYEKYVASYISYHKSDHGAPVPQDAFYLCSLYWEEDGITKYTHGSADTMHIAICKAALESCGVEVEA